MVFFKAFAVYLNLEVLTESPWGPHLGRERTFSEEIAE